MAPTSSSTTPSSTGQSPDPNFRVVRKRNRIPLSCGPCRHRKLKCNRAHPCDNCTKRGDIDSCTYASPNARKKSASSNSSNGTPDEMQNRIDRLEGLVLSLMTNGPNSAGPTAANAVINGTGPLTGGSIGSSASPGFSLDVEGDDMIREECDGTGDESEVDQVAKSIGVMKVDNNKSFFIPENHWYSILAEISEVKNWFSDHKKQFDETLKRAKPSGGYEDLIGASFLCAVEKASTKAEILRQLPPKATCDLLITRYFDGYNMNPNFQLIHGPGYQKQYDNHWLNPQETPIMWLGQTFGMMTLGLQSFMRTGDEPQEYRGKLASMLRDYRRLTAQCIAFSDISVPDVGSVETMVLFLQTEYNRTRDSEAGLLMLMTMIVRLAMRMGYHRDSSYFPQISVYQGEMRRRAWATIRSCDLLFSIQCGLPPLIQSNVTNTELPSNLYDDELTEDMKALPPSRPSLELTPVSYLIYKTKVLRVFTDIVDETQNLTRPSYDRVMALDEQLNEIQANIPPVFRMRPLEESLRDPPVIAVQRYVLDSFALRATIVLHRKFICPSRDNSRYLYSRQRANDSSLELLRHQALLHRETQPGGRLEGVKWFVVGSLATQDYLLAGTIVALDLYSIAEAERTNARLPKDYNDWSTQERRATMTTAIEQSLAIWSTTKGESIEAFKATGILTAMLEKLKLHDATQQLRQQSVGGGTTNFGAASQRYSQSNSPDDTKMAPEHSAAMTLGMLSTGALTPGTANMFANYDGANGSGATQQQGTAATSGMSNGSGTGLTPGYFGNGADGGNIASAFPNFFTGAGMGFGLPGNEMAGTGFDWDALDTYMGTSTLDPNSNNVWSTNVDANTYMDPSAANGNIDPYAGAQNQQQQQQRDTNNMFALGGNVFMGSGTATGRM